MQRRAAAGYVVLFLVLAAGAYALLSVTTAPSVDVGDPDHELEAGDQFTVDGRTYTVRSVSAEETEGDGHGGGGGIEYAATLAWTNESATYSETWDAGDSVAFEELDFAGARLNGSYDVVVPNVSDPSTATLRAAPENLSTVDRDGVTYVEVEEDDGSIRLVPIDEYDQLQRVTVEEGTFDYRGNQTTLTVTEDGVELAWTAPTTETVDLGQTQNATLNGREYFTYFRSDEVVTLTTDVSTYRQSVAANDRYHERQNGLWGITIVGGFAALLLTGLAYLPRKDV